MHQHYHDNNNIQYICFMLCYLYLNLANKFVLINGWLSKNIQESTYFIKYEDINIYLIDTCWIKWLLIMYSLFQFIYYVVPFQTCLHVYYNFALSYHSDSIITTPNTPTNNRPLKSNISRHLKSKNSWQ